MRLRSATTLLPALVLSLAATPGVSDPTTCRPYDDTVPPDDPAYVELCEIDTYLQCPANDAEKVRHPAIEAVVPLDHTRPTRSVTEGAGCGHLDEPVFGSTTMDSLYEFNAGGRVAGAIDSATFDLWVLGPGVGQLGEEVELDVRFTIKGKSVFGTEEVTSVTGEPSSLPLRRRVTAEVLPSDTMASALLRFTVTDIGAYLGDTALSSANRSVALTVNYPHTGDCATPPPNGAERCAPAGVHPWAWGSTEVPAGLSFNRTDDLGTLVPAGEAAS